MQIKDIQALDRIWKGLVLNRKGKRAIQLLKLEIYYQEICGSRSVSKIMEIIAINYADLQARYELNKSVDTNEQTVLGSKLHIAV